MNGAIIQNKVWRGYGKCALRIGFNYKFYRPGNPPVPTGNYDTPGRKMDSGQKLDQSFEEFNTGDTFDGDKQFDQAANPDLVDQTRNSMQLAPLSIALAQAGTSRAICCSSCTSASTQRT